MQRTHHGIASPAYLPLTLAAVQAVLIGGMLWQLSHSAFPFWEIGGSRGDIALQIGRNEADTVATAHIPGRVVDTDAIRDNGVISYLVTVAPDNAGSDATLRRLVFVDPGKQSVWRDEAWSTQTRQSARISQQQAETTALTKVAKSGKIKSADLLSYEGRDVWLVKTGGGATPSWLVTIDAGSGEVLRSFELLRDY